VEFFLLFVAGFLTFSTGVFLYNLFKSVRVQNNKTVLFIQVMTPVVLKIKVIYKRQGAQEWKTYVTTVASLLTCKSSNFELAVQELFTRWHDQEFYGEDLQVRNMALQKSRDPVVMLVDYLSGVKYPDKKDTLKGLMEDYKRNTSAKGE
jgi:hypothetical protein